MNAYKYASRAMDDISSEVRRYLRYLRRYWWVLIGGVVVGLFGWVLLRDDSTSPSRGQVQVTILGERWRGVSSDRVSGGLFGEDPDALAVGIARVSATNTLDEITRGEDVSPDQIKFALDGRRVLVDISADVDTATTIADRIATQLNKYRVADILQPINTASVAAHSRLDSLEVEIAATASGPDRAALMSEAAQLTTEVNLLAAATQAVSVEVTTDVLKHNVLASSGSRSSSRSNLMAIVFAVSGFALAGVLVVFWSVLDRRILTRRDAEAITGPDSLLGVVPARPSPSDVKAAAAAISQLRAANGQVVLVGLGTPTVPDAVQTLASAAEVAAITFDDLVSQQVPQTSVLVVPVGKVSDRELRSKKFLLERAGAVSVRPILVGARRVADALD
jgi:capsular polysaccharide biosynthesis protein